MNRVFRNSLSIRMIGLLLAAGIVVVSFGGLMIERKLALQLFQQEASNLQSLIEMQNLSESMELHDVPMRNPVMRFLQGEAFESGPLLESAQNMRETIAARMPNVASPSQQRVWAHLREELANLDRDVGRATELWNRGRLDRDLDRILLNRIGSAAERLDDILDDEIQVAILHEQSAQRGTLQRSILAVSLFGTAGVVVLLVGAVFLLHQLVFRPLQLLTSGVASHQIGGPFRLQIRGAREIVSLAAAVRGMRENLLQASTMRQRAKLVMRGLCDFVVFVDREGRVITVIDLEENEHADGSSGETLHARWAGRSLADLSPDLDEILRREARSPFAHRQLSCAPIPALHGRGPFRITLRATPEDHEATHAMTLQDQSRLHELSRELDHQRSRLVFVQQQIELAKRARDKAESDMLEVAEREQERLGRELHDSLGQELAGAAFLAKALASRLEEEHHPRAFDAQWVKDVVSRSIETVRAVSRRLSPTHLEGARLQSMLQRLADDSCKLFGIRARTEFHASQSLVLNHVSSGHASHLYRITQEAITNATRHGACKEVLIHLSVNGDHLRLCVIDDGVGPPARAAGSDPGAGVGLASIQYRALAMSGRARLLRYRKHTFLMTCIPLSSMFAAPGMRAGSSQDADPPWDEIPQPVPSLTLPT
jgi:signal transduction histidine kinase